MLGSQWPFDYSLPSVMDVVSPIIDIYWQIMLVSAWFIMGGVMFLKKYNGLPRILILFGVFILILPFSFWVSGVSGVGSWASLLMYLLSFMIAFCISFLLANFIGDVMRSHYAKQ